ncbi:MAG: protein phosphatase CheZ [Gammaproteobacteria bacterium]|nr:protein phosphatase CheZ [Gammaproteobacteria bacterium]
MTAQEAARSCHTKTDTRLDLAKTLVRQLESGDQIEADKTFAMLTDQATSGLFKEVGRLTRDLHDAINGFLLDSRIVHLAEHEMPDASQRLSYVINMTEQAANTSLAAVEASLPLAGELGRKARDLSFDWKRFQGRELSVDEFRELSRNLLGFLQTTGDHADELHEKLSDVLMAQDFQDLTGQIIRQVITLIKDVEEKLVHLVRISGATAANLKPDSEKLEGPVIPGIDQGDVMSGQDDVDDLLSSLGF